MSGPMIYENDQRGKELAELVEYLLEMEEIQWMQRSRADWLKNGDRNTVFFSGFCIGKKEKELCKKIEE